MRKVAARVRGTVTTSHPEVQAMAPSRKSLLPMVEKLEARAKAGDVVGALKGFPPLLRVAAARLSSRRRRERRKWDGFDVLCHLLDTELVHSFRIRKVLCEEVPDIAFYEQEQWVDGLRPFRGGNPARVAARCAALRADNVAVLSALAPRQWLRSGVHPEAGVLTVADLAARMARHDAAHLRQMVAG